jgi:hypothetical protein
MSIAGYIGDYAFCSMRGGILLPQMMREVVYRSGVTGETVFFGGLHSKPFWLECCSDYLTLLDAHNASGILQAATALQPQPLVRAGVVYPCDFHILDVIEIEIKAISGAVGGIQGSGSRALVRTNWQLLAVTPLENPFS